MPQKKKSKAVVAAIDADEPILETVTYTAETPASIAQHQHTPYRGHTPEWYALWGNKCPTCGVTPEFGEQTIERVKYTSKRIFGMKPGGKF